MHNLYVIVIVASCVFSGVCSEEELLIVPSTSPYTVVEGSDVKLTCYTRNMKAITKWNIEDIFVALTKRNETQCRVVYAPNDIYSSEKTTASCNRTSFSIMIEKVTNAEAKNWSCSSGGFHAHVLLKMVTPKDLLTSPQTTDVPRESENSSYSTYLLTSPPTTDVPRKSENTSYSTYLLTSPPTTDVPRESENTSHSTYLLTSPPTTDVPRESENTSYSTYPLTSPPTTDVSRESENASTTFQQSDMDVDYKLVIICAGAAGGILAFVLLLVGLLKLVASVRDHVSKRERTRASSTSSLAEMAENPVYWTAGNMTASEARDETSVADGGPGNENPVYWTAGNMTASEARDETSVADGGPGNDDVADLYSKVQKPCIKGVNRTARNDDILLGGRMVKELSTTVELSDLYAKVQKSGGGEAEGRTSTDNNVLFGGWVPEEQSRDVNTVETLYSKVQRSEVKPKTEPESGDICAKTERRKEIPSDKLEEQS